MSDLISRQTVIDAIDDIESEIADGDGFQYAKWREYFCDLPSAQPDMSEYSSKLWRNAYERGKRDAQLEEDCDTCKHGYFGDDKCNNCRVRYPSHYERRTDESD